MRTLLRLSTTVLLTAALGAGLTGCSEEEDANRIVVDVVSLNGNGPLFSDVYNLNGTPDDPLDDFIPVDVIEVTFEARPHDNVLTLSPFGGPFSSVRFTRYSIKFEDGVHASGADLNGDGIVDLENFTASMNVVVPVFTTQTAFVLVVGGGIKTQPPLVQLRGGGEYRANGRITFYGTEETSGEKIEITRGLNMRFADFGDE